MKIKRIKSRVAKCDCYENRNGCPVCFGTKEKERCTCGGNTAKCDFYIEVRERK